MEKIFYGLLSLSVKDILLVMAGGSVGALSRYVIQMVVSPFFPNFPLAATLINIGGCFIAGMLLPLIFIMGDPLRSFLMIGFLGAFTTYSTFSLDIIELLRGGRFSAALLYWFLAAVGCVAAAMGGMLISRKLLW